MPRSLQQITDHAKRLTAEEAELLADRLEEWSPAADDDGHREAVANLRSATVARARAEQALADAVHAARASGLSFGAIGLVVGTSGEAVRKRYGKPDAALSRRGDQRRRAARWSAAELQQLRTLAKRGTPSGEIGLQLGRSEASVRSQAARHGISLRRAAGR
jgi:hypothetical protein